VASVVLSQAIVDLGALVSGPLATAYGGGAAMDIGTTSNPIEGRAVAGVALALLLVRWFVPPDAPAADTLDPSTIPVEPVPMPA
jgi:hypothetical protein